MNDKTQGKVLFEAYLESQKIIAEHEPVHPHTNRRPDFCIQHANGEKLIVEVKDIYVAPPRGGGLIEFNKPIRRHIDAARKQFGPFKDNICLLVLRAAAGSFVDLSTPEVMLGSMYGNVGFALPFDPASGRFDASRIRREFIVGDGKMIRRTENHHTRISAILTLHEYDIQAMRYSRCAQTDEGYAAVLEGSIQFPEERALGITVWENGVANKPLPRDIFRGPYDKRWSIEGDAQDLTFVGESIAEFHG